MTSEAARRVADKCLREGHVYATDYVCLACLDAFAADVVRAERALLAEAMMRWSIRDHEGADVFAGDRIPFWETWEQIRSALREEPRP